MDNRDILTQGTKTAKKLIEEDIINRILIPTANEILDYVVQKRIHAGHNMTGNTINAYVVGVFAKGNLVYMRGSWESVPAPLKHKVYKYWAGDQRWDGETQEHDFPTKGVAQHNGTKEPDRAISFIKSYNSPSDRYVLVVANGIEYATFEENVYGADTLTGTLDYFKLNHSMFFKPITI